jgi:hypothetical protein
MAATTTVTGKVGPAITLTAGVFTGIAEVNFNCTSNVLSLTDSSGKVFMVDITAAATITATKSSSTYTFTVS